MGRLIARWTKTASTAISPRARAAPPPPAFPLSLSLARPLALALLPLALCACSELSVCEGIDLAGGPSVRAAASTVLALSDREHVTVIRSNPLRFEQITVRNSADTPVRPDQLLLTASGRWLTYRVGSDVFSVDLDAPSHPRIGFSDIDEIVGTLRGGDWLIYRSWGVDTETMAVGDSSLEAIYVGDPAELPADHPSRFVLGAGKDLRVVAMGHRHLVAREILGDGRESLYLIRIAPARQVDWLGAEQLGLALPLTHGSSFTRVVMTEGPSPAQLGHNDEFQRQIPTDTQVIATSGEWPEARTLIYSVADLGEIANFEGAVVTSQLPRENVAGLDPVSPSGTHLAYIARTGALALRDLDTQDSCMVRSSVGKTHQLAGFGADATLYFESSERDFDRAGSVATFTNVYAYNPWTRHFAHLTSASTQQSKIWRLHAVPPEADEQGKPWAVVVNNQHYLARSGQEPRVFEGVDEAAFVPRAGTSEPAEGPLWMLESKQDTQESYLRVTPVRAEGADPVSVHQHDYTPNTSVCLSTAQSTNLTSPWASRCASADDAKGFLDNGPPASEQEP